MTTQTVEFQATPGQSITVRRFARYGDTILESVAATERTNKRGWYAVDFDTAGGVFDLSFMVGSNCIGVDQVELTDTVDTFQTNGVKAGQSTDLVSAIWSAGSRTLTGFGTLVSDTATAVWASGSRTLTSFGTLVSDTVTAIQSYLYGSGARTVTITVNDGATALQNARVRLTSGVTSHARDTNVSGVAVFNVDDATWTVSITRSGYTFAGASLVVDGTETATYSMTVITISEPAEPGLCTVRFEVRDADGTTPVQGASVKAVLDPNNAVSGILLSNAVHSGTTNSSGICDLVLVQGKSIIRGNKLYTITVTDPGSTTSEPLMKITGVVPNQTTAYASELIPRNM